MSNKVQSLSEKTRERQRRDKQRQGFAYADENQWQALCAFIEPIATAAADRAARDYLDQKDLVSKVYLNERLNSTEKLFDEKLKRTEANLRQEMGKQSTELRQEMGKLRQEMGNKMLGGFAALAALITLLAFFKPEPGQTTQYVPMPYPVEQQTPKVPGTAAP